WILESEEDAGGCALGRVHFEDRLAVIEDVALSDLVVFLAGENVGQGRLAGAVRPHDRGDFACLDGQIESADDLGAVFGDAGMQVLDFKHSLFFLKIYVRDQPTEPSSEMPISFCASTANSIGSSWMTSLTKPLTISAMASSSGMPRCMT